MTLTSTCHCGAVEVSVPRAPERVTLCNCSICRRYGALWGYYLPREVVVKARGDATRGYVWGDRMIRFVHCATCGCVTHYDLIASRGDDDTMAVNMRMFAPEQVGNVKIRRFDGAVTWKYLED